MLINFIKGMLIGVANIIPGVSGGTFALILGIYHRLINALGGIDMRFVGKILLPRKFVDEFKKIDGFFLLEIAAGAALSLIAFSWIIDYLLKIHPGFTLSFFMGLIIPSIAVPYKMIKKKSWNNFVFILPGILLVSGIYLFRYTGAGHYAVISLPFLFLSGILAVSAMILPGISGSLLLLLMGVYESIISNIKIFSSSFSLNSFIFLSIFGAGCILGLFLFVRVMSFLFHKYRDKTLYFLVGLVLGSLVVLWPFKKYPQITGAEKMEITITTAKNSLPESAKSVFGYSLLFVMGLLGSYGLNRLAKQDNK